jgi:hypothetical protein
MSIYLATLILGLSAPVYQRPICDTVVAASAVCGDRQHQIMREKPLAELSRDEFEQYLWTESRCQDFRDRAISDAQHCRVQHASAKARFEADFKEWQSITPEERHKKRDTYLKLSYVSAGLTVASVAMYYTLDNRCDEMNDASESDPTNPSGCSERLRNTRDAYGLFSFASLLTAGISMSLANSMR